jgi:hypothetical protein
MGVTDSQRFYSVYDTGKKQVGLATTAVCLRSFLEDLFSLM